MVVQNGVLPWYKVQKTHGQVPLSRSSVPFSGTYLSLWSWLSSPKDRKTRHHSSRAVQSKNVTGWQPPAPPDACEKSGGPS